MNVSPLGDDDGEALMPVQGRRDWGALSFYGGLLLTVLILLVVGTVRPDQGGPNSGDSAQPQGKANTPPPWMHKLRPGERPPQFVLFSFDGVGSHEHWQRVLPIAQRTGAHFSGFLSGIYLLPDDQRNRYTGPGHNAGKASIGFGGSAQDVRTRVDDLNRAVAQGVEIGTHYNGHFCSGNEPSVGTWTRAQWTRELDEFFAFVRGTQGLHVNPATIKGGRTPCLEGKFDQVMPALAAHGMTYDSSQVSDGVAWPVQQHGVWEFWMPLIKVSVLNGKKVIMMDYNLWYQLNGAQDDPSRSVAFKAVTLDTYRSAYTAALRGNRAPLVVANHFNDWAGRSFSDATEQFMGEVCTKPETVCATYSEVITWMKLQDPKVLTNLRNQPNAQAQGT
jgi:hypothetical protein